MDPNPNINGRDHYLKQLNNLSHKISKPIITKKPNLELHNRNPPPPPPPSQQPAQQPQPRVYNINKNDFRDVVQRLTGSPAHDSFSTPQPVQPPKPPSSRLHRIRPPPLPQLTNRATPLVHPQPPQPLLNPPINNIPLPHAPPMNGFSYRPPPPPPPSGPLSPYLPSPAFQVAESPVSVYMRYLQNSMSSESNTPPPFSGFSPQLQPQNHQFNQQPPHAPPQHPQMIPPAQFQIPNSPGMPFGFLNSPKSPFPLLSPSLLLSPYSFPLSPTVPLPSPGWRGFN